MREVPQTVKAEVLDQISRASTREKQKTTLLSENAVITTYWVVDILRVDIKLPKE